MTDPKTVQSDIPDATIPPEETASPHESPTQSSPAERDTHVTAGRHRIHKRVFFFGTLALLAVIAFCIANANSFNEMMSNIGEILTPLVIGCVIAYLCNPFLKFYEYVVFGRLKSIGLRRGLSLLCTFLTALGILAGVIALIVPELVASISQLVTNFEDYLDRLLVFVQGIIDKITANLPEEYRDVIDISDRQKLTELIEQLFGSMEDALQKVLGFLQGFVVDENLLGNIWTFIVNLFNALKNVVLGIFIAIYLLSSKDKRIAQLRKFRAAFFTDKQDSKINEIVRLVDRTFGGYIKGLMLDALAVGVVTFILLSVCQVSEYNLLIAAICAITNIIPVFGPFIGAIPSALIVLISNPSKLIVFIILVVVIQQIDGNLLCPLIQGNNTGISSLAVLVAITVMGSIGGIAGMVIGVPIFAVIIELVKRSVETRLVERGVPTDTTYYYPKNAVANAEEEVYYEHSHLRYVYDHSKLKVHVDNTVAAFGRAANHVKANVLKHQGTAAPLTEEADAEAVEPTPNEDVPADNAPVEHTADSEDKTPAGKL